MSKRHSLYFTDHHVTISDAADDGLSPLLTLRFAEEDYLDKLRTFVDQTPLGTLSIFIDVMGEEIKHENIPHIGLKDRERLLQRKFKSLFPGADLTWKHHLKREKTGRKDDIFLLMGVSLPAPVKEILAVLVESQQTVCGLYLLPLLQQQLVKLLPENTQSLIISSIAGNRGEKATYRQTFFKKAALTVSRMNNASGATEQERFDLLFKEIERTYQFLEGTRQLSQENPLDVIVMLTSNDAACLIDHSSNMNIDLKFASLSELAQKLGIHSTAPYQSLPELLCHLATAKDLKPHLQPADICNQHKVGIVKRRLSLSSVAAILVSLLIAGGLWFSAHQENQRYTEIIEKTAKTRQQKSSLAETLPETSVPPKIMHQAVQLYQQVARSGNKPERILNILASAYQGFHDIELKRIIWVNKGQQLSDDDEFDTEVISDSGTFTTSLKAPSQFKVVISPDPQMSARAMLARVDSFSASLLEQPEITQVIREKSAIDTSSSAQLEETLGGRQGEKLADFTLMITM